VIGVIDESTPFDADGQVVYAMALVCVPGDDVPELSSFLVAALRRTRPFHWERDRGSDVRSKVVASLGARPLRLCAAAARCAPREQATVRALLLDEVLLPFAFRVGVTGFVLEQRSNSENEADGRSIRNWYRPTPERIPTFRHVGKTEPLTWLADAVSGIWSDAILGRGDGMLERLAASGNLEVAVLQR
jgi:hypothetical protein